jgi:diguanylate cyclase (GGDEF)-like protein
LRNRPRFHARLAQTIGRAKRENPAFALHYLDLDQFNAVNDTFGPQAGDAVSRDFRRRVRALVGPDDWFARLGGDAFAFPRAGSTDGSDLCWDAPRNRASFGQKRNGRVAQRQF